MTKTKPQFTMMVGAPPKGCKSSTLVMLARKRRSKWWQVVCFGQKSHYRKDGSCVHTDEALSRLNTEIVKRELVRVVPFGDKEAV